MNYQVKDHEIEIIYQGKEFIIIIDFDAEFITDDGVRTYSNGDPGYPPSSEMVDFEYDIKECFINAVEVSHKVMKYSLPSWEAEIQNSIENYNF